MFDLALVNGYIVDTDRIYKGNLYVTGEKIAAISEKTFFDAKEVVDVSGMLLFPGGIDTHMHIGEYKADFEEMDTSTAAAVVGGMTCLLDMPLNLMTPSVVNVDIFKEKKEHLLEKSYADFCMYAALVPSNIKQLEKLHNEGAIAFKSFLPGAGSDFFAPEMKDIRKALQTIASFDGIAAFHCEDNSIIHSELEDMKKNKKNSRQAFLDSRPLCAETIAVRDVIELAEAEHAKIHICHVSHPKVAKIIEQAKARNIDVSAETCIHYLTFTEKDFISKGCFYKCAPPLRSEEASEGLWKYLENGTFVSMASDHSPGMPEDRSDENKPIYDVGNGISGVQTLFQTYYDRAVKRKYSPCLISRTLSEQPAKRFGIYGRKGALKVGFDADIVVFDPDLEWKVSPDELYYKQKISAFVGLEGKGKPVSTYIRGNLVARNGEIIGLPGGNFITRL